MRPFLTALAVGLLTLLAVGPVAAQGPAPEEPTPEAAEEVVDEGLGVLKLQLSPGSRVTVSEQLDDGLLRISMWHQEGPIGSQVARAGLPAILTFSAVPISRNAVRLDLRLDPAVKGVSVRRGDEGRLEIQLSDRSFAGASVQLEARRSAEDVDAALNTDRDLPMAAILDSPAREAPTFVEWPPVTWPIGSTSPVQALILSAPEPHPFSHPPIEVREAWAGSPTVDAAIALAEQGEVVDASRMLAGLPMPNDATRALVALARARTWSRPDVSGEPIAPGRAADAYLLAAALQPNASWTAWARGQAGYGYERERSFEEALLQYRKAIALAPEHSDRVHWEVGVGMSLLGRRDRADGINHLVDVTGGLPVTATAARFAARRAVSHALWHGGEFDLAAAVVDLLLADSPEIARSSAYDLRWARIYFDAGRSAAALPFLERMDADATRRVDRERARWWLHEAALVHRDSLTARKWLRRILEGTPGSTLVPLVRIRLEVLDAIEAEGAGKDLSWQEVALDLRTHALQWPHTPIEDEALSLTAQLFVELGLVEDALSLYRWIEERTPSVGGAIAYEHLVCRAAPQAFHELRGRGELIRALGIYRGFLDEPVMHGCVDVATRSDAASTAMTAGLPTLAARWLGQAVAEGTGGLDETRNLLALAEMYLVEGKIDAAAQTLDYLEGAALPEPSGLVDAAWGDVHLAQGEWAEAVTAFDAALEQVEGSVRTRGRAASLHYRRGLALDRLGRHDEAIAELRVGLDGGGADDPATGWLRLASALSRGGGDAATWEAILVSCDQAEAAGSDEQTLRALSWYRSQAMLGLGRAEEAKVLLDELATGPDTWALMARESMASTAFDASLEAILGAPSEP